MISSITLFPKSIPAEKIAEITVGLVDSVKHMPGCRGVRVSKGDLMSPAGPPTYSSVIEVSWDSLQDMMAWVQGPGSQEDKDYLVENGAVLLFYEMVEV